MPRFTGSTALLLALAVGASGCGEQTADQDELKATIVEQFGKQGAQLRDVTCAGEIKAEVGEKISCTARNQADTKLIIEGSVTAVDGEKARFSVKGVGAIAKASAIAADARKIIEAEVGEAAQDFTCPGTEIRLPTKTPVVCALTATDGAVIDALVSVDAKGSTKVEIADAPRG